MEENMKRYTILPLVAILACGDKEETDLSAETTETADEVNEPSDDSGGGEPDLANGQEIHDTMCMVCHASETAMSDRVPEMEDEHLEEVIVNGVGPMPPQNVSGDDLVDLIAFLRQEYP